MACTPSEFFELYFRELERHGIASVVLHSYENYPQRVTSDIDYAVAEDDLHKIAPLLARLAREHGWALVQTLQHQVFAIYHVVIDPGNPSHHLKLDVCSHYVKDHCFLLRDVVLLSGRRMERDFYVPAPAGEFIYVLAKVFGKNKPVAGFLPRLRELWMLDPAGAQRQFGELFGDTGRTLEEWFREPAERWESLNCIMRSRNRYGPALWVAEAWRVATRALQPTGLHIAVLGSDGAGKSTLLENLGPLLEPCFRHQRVLHFRPMVFEKNKGGVVSQPHAQRPRGLVAGWLKLFYYFADWWLGWLLVLLPARIRSTLIVADRNFDDILIDPKRYRIQGADVLARILWGLLPRADATFILDADPQTIHARKPELPVEELERQREAFQELSSGDVRWHLVPADQPPEEVARAVSRKVILLLAARSERRMQNTTPFT